ncbi:threonylcarbamoyl-AMP synthase [bacterium]|nr:threonylcarbamoyl-AMP synthase [bacterium]
MSGLLTLKSYEIEKALSILKHGGVIGYPTETVYGLGGIATDARVVSRIQNIKRRNTDKPMLILIPHSSFLLLVAENIHEYVFSLMDNFWPGPLTLVFRARSGLPDGLIGGDGSIGIRVSSDPICQQLLTELNAPLISTSANPSNQPPARSAEMVQAYFKDQLDAILDGGKRNQNEPSTIIDVRFKPAQLIRNGSIKTSAIRQFIGDIIASENV